MHETIHLKKQSIERNVALRTREPVSSTFDLKLTESCVFCHSLDIFVAHVLDFHVLWAMESYIFTETLDGHSNTTFRLKIHKMT